MSVDVILWILVSATGAAGSALCSGMEIGFYTMNRLRLRVAEARGSRAARILHRLTDQPDRVLTGLLIGNNIFNYLCTLGITALLVGTGLGEVAVVLISAAVVTPMLLIFCEALPKDTFRIEADVIMPKLAHPLAWWLTILSASGLPALLSLLARGIGRVVGVVEQEVTRDARARVAALLKEGAGAGLLSPSQTTLLDRALIFSRATVADEMTPWSAAQRVRASTPAAEAARRLSAGGWGIGGGGGVAQKAAEGAGETGGTGGASGTAGWAVVIDQRGQPVGVVRRLDLLLADGGDVAAHMRPLVALKRATPLHTAATELARARVGLGIVMRGQRAIGVVPMEDLAEPLTGDLSGW